MGTSAHCPRNLIEACVMLATQRARRPVAAAWALRAIASGLGRCRRCAAKWYKLSVV